MEDFDLYADEELYEDEEEEEEVAEGEGPNRTFIILVAALGGLLAVTVCVFVIWALVINPRMTGDRVAQNQAIAATNEALLATAGMVTGTVTIEGAAPDTDVATDAPVPTDVPGPTDTAEPSTATPRPTTATPVLPTPTLAEAAEATPVETPEATPAEMAEANTPTPPATPRATPTPRPGKTGVPETGIGALGASVLAVGLLFLLIVVRRMRRAV